MITHRVATRVAPEPPVRFYKTIAISFLVITIVLLGIVIFFTSKKATVIIVAKTDAKNVSFNLIVGGKAAEGASSIEGVVTSTQFFYSQKYYPTGNKTADGTAAGEVTLYNQTGSAQTLVKTTRLLTPEGVLFRLSDRVVVPAKGSAQAQVYADKPGASGNIGPSKFTIPGLNEEKQKVIYAESQSAMAGGVRKIGILTEEDLKNARADYVKKVKAEVSKILEKIPGFDKNVVSVPDFAVTSDKSAGEEVSEFVLSGTSTVRAAMYNSNALKAIIQKEASRLVDVGSEKVLSVGNNPQVSLASYDVASNSAQITISQDIMVTLDVNADKLAVSNFYNKKKDEIEKYAYGLGHVVGVEVKFSPSWMRTAPAVSDRVKVIVKNVE